MSRFASPPTWKQGDPTSARKLNDMSRFGVREITAGPGLLVSRFNGIVNLSLAADDRPVSPTLRAKVTTMPSPGNPDVYGVTLWDGTDVFGYEVSARLLVPHSLDDDVIVFRPLGGTGRVGLDNNLPAEWEELNPQVSVTVRITGAPGAADTAGEYKTAIVETGLASTMPPLGMTDSTIAVVVENVAEKGLVNHAGATYQNSHWLPTGVNGWTGPGTVIGATADVPPRPIVAINAPVPAALFDVTLTTDGGVNGTWTAGPPAAITDATYTYTVTDLAGNTLGTAMSPVWPRPHGPLDGPATEGACCYDGSGNLKLKFTNEQAAAAACG